MSSSVLFIMDEAFITKLIKKHKLHLDCNVSLESIAFQYEQAEIDKYEINIVLESAAKIAEKFPGYRAVNALHLIDKTTQRFFEEQSKGSMQALYEYLENFKYPRTETLERGIEIHYAPSPVYLTEIPIIIRRHHLSEDANFVLYSIAGQYREQGVPSDEIVEILDQVAYITQRVDQDMESALKLLDNKTEKFFTKESRGSMDALYGAVKQRTRINLDKLNALVTENYLNNGS